MSVKDVEFSEAFEKFWMYVERAERQVRENEHRGRLPPICQGDPWDEGFAAAYERLVPYLRKFRKERFYPVQSGLAFRAAPIAAQTAHQALMFFLNPPDELFGETGVLDASEYSVIKAAAIAELQDRDTMRMNRNDRRKKLVSRRRQGVNEGEFSDAAFCLLAFLMRQHGCNADVASFEAVEQSEIADVLRGEDAPWYQSKVSRAMAELMQAIDSRDQRKAMVRYRRLCESQ